MTTDSDPSTTKASSRFARLWTGLTAPRRSGGAWRVLAVSEIQRLNDELQLTAAPFEIGGVTGAGDPKDYVKSIQGIVRGHLEEAEDALDPVSRRAAVWAWYTGSSVEQAWLNIHRASEALLMIQSPGSLIREFLEIDGAFRATIAAADPRYANLALLLKESNQVLMIDQRPDRLSAIMRSKLKAVRNAANVASDTTHETVRRWRNLLVLGGVVLGVLAIIVSLVHIAVPNFISLAPPGGWGRGSSVQPWEVILLGSVGGALAAVLALNRFSGFTDPSGLPVVQALLRIPTAAATSLIGVLLMQTATLDVLKPQHGATVLTYGFFFGYAQEPLLRAIDRRAGMVLEPARNKDEPAKTIPATAAAAPGKPQTPEHPQEGEHPQGGQPPPPPPPPASQPPPPSPAA